MASGGARGAADNARGPTTVGGWGSDTGNGLERVAMVRRLMRWLGWGGRRVRYVFVHPACGGTDVEAGFLPEWGTPRFMCRRCGVAFDEARVRLGWSEPDPQRQ